MLDSTRLDRQISLKKWVLTFRSSAFYITFPPDVIFKRACQVKTCFSDELHFRTFIEPSRTGPLFGSVRLNRVSNRKTEFDARFGSTRFDSIAISVDNN